MKKESFFYAQAIPLSIAVVSTIFFLGVLIINTHVLNRLFSTEPIRFIFLPLDILLGFYLYVKTSVDFAVFIGSMMVANRGWKNRVAVEWGTSLGNFLGTIFIIWIWTIFRTVGPIVEGIIVILASFVLLELAAGSLERLKIAGWDKELGFKGMFYKVALFVLKVRQYTAPFLGWMPDVEGAMAGKKIPTLRGLILYSFTVPFILGSDDFAGYIAVFNVVNVLSFATGVVIGHGLLLAGLFAAPMTVEKLMGNPWFSALAVTTFFAIFGIGVNDGSRSLLLWGHENTKAFTILLLVLVIWASSRRIRETVRTGFSDTQAAAFRLLVGLLERLKIISPRQGAVTEKLAFHRKIIHKTRQIVTTGWEKTRAAALSLTRKISP